MNAPTTSRARRRATTFRRVGWLAVAAMTTLALVGPAAGPALATDPVYATVTGHEGHSDKANQPEYWGDNCEKIYHGGDTGQFSSYVLTQNYGKVIVKAGSGDYANTIFGANPLSGQTVWADTNGDFAYNPGGQDGDKNISHIIACGPTTTTTTTTGTTTTGTTTTGTTTTGTTTTDTTTTGTTTQATTTQATTTQATTTQATTTQATTTTDTTTGAVEAATGRPTVTPPPTDALPTIGTPGSDSWRLALLAIAGLLATLLLLAPATPVKARRRR